MAGQGQCGLIKVNARVISAQDSVKHKIMVKMPDSRADSDDTAGQMLKKKGIIKSENQYSSVEIITSLNLIKSFMSLI